MKHPNTQIQKRQDEFLQNCPDGEREYHARIFRIGNASIHYQNLAFSSTFDDEKLKIYYLEWLEGLPVNIRTAMEKKGFDNCKTMLPFTRYINERGNDIGMDAWMKEHISEEDYKYYKGDR